MTTTRKRRKLRPLFVPGDVLRDDFMEPLRLTINRLALELRVPATRIQAILSGQRAITADTALRLERYFGEPAEYWLYLEAHYQLGLARQEKAEAISREVIPAARQEKFRRPAFWQNNRLNERKNK